MNKFTINEKEGYPKKSKEKQAARIEDGDDRVWLFLEHLNLKKKLTNRNI